MSVASCGVKDRRLEPSPRETIVEEIVVAVAVPVLDDEDEDA